MISISMSYVMQNPSNDSDIHTYDDIKQEEIVFGDVEMLLHRVLSKNITETKNFHIVGACDVYQNRKYHQNVAIGFGDTRNAGITIKTQKSRARIFMLPDIRLYEDSETFS